MHCIMLCFRIKGHFCKLYRLKITRTFFSYNVYMASSHLTKAHSSISAHFLMDKIKSGPALSSPKIHHMTGAKCHKISVQQERKWSPIASECLWNYACIHSNVKNPIIPSVVRVMSDNIPDLSLDSIKGCFNDQCNKFRSVRSITFNPFHHLDKRHTRLINRQWCASARRFSLTARNLKMDIRSWTTAKNHCKWK